MASTVRSRPRPPSHRFHIPSSFMSSTVTLLALLLVALAYLGKNEVSASFQPRSSDINIGAFNVQRFGFAKTRIQPIMTEIARIVAQFDIIVIQEILNNADVAEVLLDYVKQCNCSTGKSCSYAYEVSQPLGENSGGLPRKCNRCPIEELSSSYKERYAFFYRPDIVQIVRTYQYQELPYARPPFAVRIKLRNFNYIPEFLFIVVHIRPQNAVDEINNLKRVYETFKQKSGIGNAIIGGDLNAGCNYWRDTQNTFLTEENGFHWLINSNTATNVAGNCPYDRFIAKGSELIQHIASGSAGAYHYANSRNITQLLSISDHYPIGMRLALGSPVLRSPPTCPTATHNANSPRHILSQQQKDPDWSPKPSFKVRWVGKRPRS